MKFERITMKTWFYIIGGISLYLVHIKNIDPSEPILSVSKLLLTFPLAFLAIFAIPKIRWGIKNYYKSMQNKINREITNLRKEQERLSDFSQIAEIDRDILYKRESLTDVQTNNFEKSAIWAIILFVITLFVIYLNIGPYLNTPTKYLGVVGFFWGGYYLTQLFRDLLIAFKD